MNPTGRKITLYFQFFLYKMLMIVVSFRSLIRISHEFIHKYQIRLLNNILTFRNWFESYLVGNYFFQRIFELDSITREVYHFHNRIFLGTPTRFLTIYLRLSRSLHISRIEMVRVLNILASLSEAADLKTKLLVHMVVLILTNV